MFLISAFYVFFFTFNSICSLYFKQVSSRIKQLRSCFFIQSDNLCLLIGMYKPFMFNSNYWYGWIWIYHIGNSFLFVPPTFCFPFHHFLSSFGLSSFMILFYLHNWLVRYTTYIAFKGYSKVCNIHLYLISVTFKYCYTTLSEVHSSRKCQHLILLSHLLCWLPWWLRR